MVTFPSRMRPSVSQGYSFDTPDNIQVQEVQGGAPLMMLEYGDSFTTYNINLVLNDFEVKVFQDFYYGKINGGVDTFLMPLDNGDGLPGSGEQLTQVKIVPNSISFDKTRAPINTVSFQVSDLGPEQPQEGVLLLVDPQTFPDIFLEYSLFPSNGSLTPLVSIGGIKGWSAGVIEFNGDNFFNIDFNADEVKPLRKNNFINATIEIETEQFLMAAIISAEGDKQTGLTYQFASAAERQQFVTNYGGQPVQFKVISTEPYTP